MTSTQDYESETAAQWFYCNLAYGRLDELPTRFLEHIIMCPNCYNVIGAVVLSAKQFEIPDDPFALEAKSMELLVSKPKGPEYKPAIDTVRSWMVLEAFRRKGYVTFNNDVLLRELDDSNAADVSWAAPKTKVTELCGVWSKAITPHLAKIQG